MSAPNSPRRRTYPGLLLVLTRGRPGSTPRLPRRLGSLFQQESGPRIAVEEAGKLFSNIPINYVSSLDKAVRGADAVVITTGWSEFASLPEIINSLESPPLLVDGRRMIDKHAVPRYEGIGLSKSQTDSMTDES